MRVRRSSLTVTLGAAMVLALALLFATTSNALASSWGWHAQKAVFVQTNNTGANRIIVYDRAWNGKLTRVTSYATGGKGGIRPAAPPPTRWPRRARWRPPITDVYFWRSTPAVTRSRCSVSAVTISG